MSATASEIHVVVSGDDVQQLSAELTRFDVPFKNAGTPATGILGFDLSNVTSLAIPAGAFTALADVITSFIKSRKRHLHFKRDGTSVMLDAENIGEEELKHYFDKVSKSGQLWLIQQKTQRTLSSDRKNKKANKSVTGKTETPDKKKR